MVGEGEGREGGEEKGCDIKGKESKVYLARRFKDGKEDLN